MQHTYFGTFELIDTNVYWRDPYHRWSGEGLNIALGMLRDAKVTGEVHGIVDADDDGETLTVRKHIRLGGHVEG